MPEIAPAWQSILVFIGYLALIAIPITFQRWAFGRRKRGEEAGADTARGAEIFIGRQKS